MVHKYFGGKLPCDRKSDALDEELLAMVQALPEKYREEMDHYAFQNALMEIFKVISRANKYIDETMPWALAKDESKKARLGTVLYNLLESIRFAATLLKPYLPETADKIFAQLAVEDKGVGSLASFGAIEAGHKVGEAEILFSRIDIPKKLAEITGVDPEAEKKAEKAAKKAEKPEVVEANNDVKAEAAQAADENQKDAQ